jgi:apolipoprotein D and lipocalin family protein
MGRPAAAINRFLGLSALVCAPARADLTTMLGNLFLAASNALRRPAPPTPALPPPATVPSVDIPRYMGRWYEVGRLPNREQDGAGRRLVDVTATYTPRRDGSVEVRNAARDAAAGMRPRGIVGRARRKDSTGAKLDVRFFGLFGGDYWVIGLDPDYRWAVVGTPSRRRLWILSRTPALPPQDWERVLGIVGDAGYNPASVARTAQSAA